MKKFISIILCAIFICAAFVTLNFSAPEASADEDTTYTSFYYFSSNPDCQTYYDGFMKTILTNAGISSANRHLYDLSDSFYVQFPALYVSGSIDYLQNALIVFEMTVDLNKQCYDKETPFVEVLKDLFADWKESGCKIMFICCTDETRFAAYNELLDYVDIHINTDMMTLLMYHIFTALLSKNSGTAEADNYFDISGTTFIISYSANYIVDEYLVPYIRRTYNLPATTATYATSAQVLVYVAKQYKIRLILQQEDGKYLDYSSDDDTPNTYSSLLTAAATIDDFDNTYSIGQIQFAGQEENFVNWLDDVTGCMYNYGATAPIYLNNPVGYTISSTYTEIYQLGQGNYNFYYGGDFETIFESFVDGDDLTQYDNWDGRCAVTYKTLTFGPDGWLNIDFDLLFGCWDIYLSQEDWEFYYGLFPIN